MKFIKLLINFFKVKYSREEKFIYIGDGITALTPGELVGKTYISENKEKGTIIENSALTITVKF